jgi:hypothetical protein
MNTRSILIGSLALLGGWFSSSCQNTPRDGEVLASRTASFAGFSQYASTQVQLQIRDRTNNSWRSFSTTTTQPSTNPATDAVGYNWFSYSRDVTLPLEAKYWALTTTSGQRRVSADVRSYTAPEGALYTFDPDDQQCLEDHLNAGGASMVLNCSDNERDATVVLDCGRNGQACCLANGINFSRYCDTGLICGSSNTCIPAGGINQPCSVNEPLQCDGGTDGVVIDCVNGPSASPYALGECRDVTVENLPIITAELAVHTCNNASAPTANSKYVSLTPGGQYFLDHPGSDTALNTTDHWGLVVPGIEKLGDIEQLSLSLFSYGTGATDSWCFDHVELIVNGTPVFLRDYTGGRWIGGTNSNVAVLATPQEMRLALLKNGRDAMCALPTEMKYGHVRRMIEGALGNTFQRSVLELATPDGDTTANLEYDASWGSPGTVSVTRLDADTARIYVRFRANNENMRDASSNPLFTLPEFAGTAEVTLDASFSCSARLDQTSTTCAPLNCTIQECTSTFQNSIELVDVQVDVDEQFPLQDTIFPQINAFAEWIAESSLRDMIGRQISKFVSLSQLFDDGEALACSQLNRPPVLAVCDAGGEVCDCPDITMGDTAVTLNWTDFGVPRLDLSTLSQPLFPLCR